MLVKRIKTALLRFVPAHKLGILTDLIYGAKLSVAEACGAS
jgi:hypothetical protein